MQYKTSLAFAHEMDKSDPLRSYRKQYHIPEHEGRPAIYFCGNSLGLQAVTAGRALQRELEKWQSKGVEAWFQGEFPWLSYHKYLSPALAKVVGAKPLEVIVMNTLTINIHLMLASFYRPDRKRFKIIIESGAFPSDQYALASQVKLRGLRPKDVIVEVEPRSGEHLLRTEDIVAAIERHGAETALVFFSGLNYYTGQFYDIPAITEAGRRVGALVGFDLAHAAGNVPLQLHAWGIDFGVWCSYKYMNGGPGGPGGIFIHERHFDDPEIHRLAGWWGYKEEERFLMRANFTPDRGAAGWQVSTATILNLAVHRDSLLYFDKIGMSALREKSKKLTGYLEFFIDELNKEGGRFQIITPRDPEARGAQLSILTGSNGKELFDYLAAKGVICDWREPNVIRVAPAPMYNSFMDVYRFAELLRSKTDS